MPALDMTSIGAMISSSDLKRRLAKESINFVCPTCGPIKNIVMKGNGILNEVVKKDLEERKVEKAKKEAGEAKGVEGAEGAEKKDEVKKDVMQTEELKVDKKETKEDEVKPENEKEKVEKPLPKKELSKEAKARIRKALYRDMNKKLNLLLVFVICFLAFFGKAHIVNFITKAKTAFNS